MSAQRLGILLSNLAGLDVEETLAPVSENDVWLVVARQRVRAARQFLGRSLISVVLLPTCSA